MTRLEICKKQLIKDITYAINSVDDGYLQSEMIKDIKVIIELNFSKLHQDQRIPEWIDPLVWEEFKNHRIKIKKKMTPYAEEVMVKSLSRAKDDGVDPNELLNAVIANGWQGIGNKANQYNGLKDKTDPTKYKGQYLNTTYQMNLARKEFKDGNDRQHTPTSKDVGSSTVRSIQYTND